MDDPASDTSATATLDIESASDRIGAMLGENFVGKQAEPSERPGIEQNAPAPQSVSTETAPAPPVTFDMPKSWKAEMRDHWSKMPRESQEYTIHREKQLLDGFSTYRPIQDALAPHQDFLARSQRTPAQAVSQLLHAQRRLVEGTDEQRWAAFQELAKHLGYEQRLMQQTQQSPDGMQPAPVDPIIQAVQQKMSVLEQHLHAEQQQKIEQIRAENQKAVDAFAADTKAHPYFDEVAEDMTLLIKSGHSLQEAYDKAVRMNPAVFEKEKAKLLTEAEAKWRENARLASLPKKKAASVNIKSNGDGPEPTEPVGSLEDTIRSVHKQIKARG